MDDELLIRRAAPEDAGGILAIYAPYIRTTAITFEYDVPDEEEFRGRISHTLEKYPYLAAELGGRIVGYAYAGAFNERAAYDWAAETSIYVDMGMKRRGIGSALYGALEKCLAAQGILNLNACIAYPDSEDEYLTRDSVRFHEKFGYSMAGRFHSCGSKFGRWYDMVWMEKMLGAHPVPPEPVRPFRQAAEGMFGADGFLTALR